MKKLAILVLVLATGGVASADIITSADTFGTGANQFTIDFVSISGDASSANGTFIGYGARIGFDRTFSDPNDFRMGTYEITNDQWNKFVNSYGTVTGNPSNAYDDSAYWTDTDVPSNGLSWYEAAQFVNYLNTSTGHQVAYKFTGTQGTSDYTHAVWEPGDIGYDSSNPYRNSNAYYFLPTEDEWVKAAYWNGTSLQTYATADDSIPIAGVDTNYYNAVGQPWNIGSGAAELNGTFDMMGNVYELMESPFDDGNYLSSTGRSHRGGSDGSHGNYLRSFNRSKNNPGYEGSWLGFRVASVPEPAIPNIDSILDIIYDSINTGTLQGEGAGNSADNKLNAFVNKIEMVVFLIDAGDPDSIAEACGDLQAAYKKCDGLKSPKDFVSGDATEELAGMILDLIEELGCE